MMYIAGNQFAGPQSRGKALEETRKLVPFRQQVTGALWTTTGPMVWLGLAGAVCLFPIIIRRPVSALPSWKAFLLQFAIMEVVHDLCLYWGHRVQHEIPFLWKHFHSEHHRLATPSPMSTGQIHPVDSFLQVRTIVYLMVHAWSAALI